MKTLPIVFHASDAKDQSIIAYGDTKRKNKHFKISYKRSNYVSFKMIDGKYHVLGICDSLDEAKQLCAINAPR